HFDPRRDGAYAGPDRRVCHRLIEQRDEDAAVHDRRPSVELGSRHDPAARGTVAVFEGHAQAAVVFRTAGKAAAVIGEGRIRRCRANDLARLLHGIFHARMRSSCSFAYSGSSPETTASSYAFLARSSLCTLRYT